MGRLRADLRSDLRREASAQAAERSGRRACGPRDALLRRAERLTMLDTTPAAKPFYPCKIEPAAQPLRFPFNLAKMLNNNVEAIPQQAYREPLVIAPGPPRMAFF